MPRYKLVKKCAAECCETRLTSRNKTGYCVKHKYKSRKIHWDKKRFQEWLDADPENGERAKRAVAEWKRKNPERVKEINRDHAKRKRSRLALEELDKVKQERAEKVQKVKERGYSGKIKSGLV